MRFHFTLVSELDNDVDIKVDQDSINIEINNIEDELSTTMNSLDFITTTIDNLITVKQHVQMFGITPQFLHLVDSDKELSNSLNIELETDTDVTVTLEGLGEAIAKGFKWLIEKIKAFGKWLLGLIPFRKKKVEAAKDNLKKENIVKEATEEIKKQQADYMKSMAQAEVKLKKNADEKDEIDKALDELINDMKDLLDEKFNEPLSEDLFQNKFFTPKIAKELLNVFFEANKAWRVGSVDFITAGTEFKVSDINKLFLSAGKDKVKYYYIDDDDFLKVDILTHDELVQKGYKELEFVFNDEDPKWTISLLEKLGEDVINFYNNFNTGVSILKKYESQISQSLKEQESNAFKKIKNNVMMMIALYNDIVTKFNNFVDAYVLVVNLSKKDIITTLVKESKEHFKK